jgi:hypothetical protein
MIGKTGVDVAGRDIESRELSLAIPRPGFDQPNRGECESKNGDSPFHFCESMDE